LGNGFTTHPKHSSTNLTFHYQKTTQARTFLISCEYPDGKTLVSNSFWK